MTDYSQHGEQQIILDYFGDYVGMVLDIGANDGKTFSNSRALLEKGWYGVLVEPSYKVFQQLEKNNADFQCQLHNCGIGTEIGVAEFYESGPISDGDDHGLVSSMKIDETKRWTTTTKPEHKVVEFEKTEIDIIDFATLLKNSCCEQFEFITIDVEGMELEILQQMDLKQLGCRLICIEYNGKPELAEAYDKLIPMPVVYKNRTNIIYGVNKQ